MCGKYGLTRNVSTILRSQIQSQLLIGYFGKYLCLRYRNSSLYSVQKYAWIFVRGRTVFRERNSRKIVNFEEQIMSKEKHKCMFWRIIEAIVFIILQYFAKSVEKILWTAYCMKCGTFSFECSLVRLNEQKKILSSSLTTTKPSLVSNLIWNEDLP